MDKEKGVGMGKKITDGIAGCILVTLVIVLAIGAYARNSFWESEIELWRDCVKKAPQKERTRHNLGYAYYVEGRLEEARKEFEAKIRGKLKNMVTFRSRKFKSICHIR